MQERTGKLIVIGGPTAVGKTFTSILLAKKLNAEVISADSRQVFRGLDIGTAKIKGAEMQNIPHHLLDILSLDQEFSAADFVTLAGQCIQSIHKKQKTVIVCGGTGFYLKSLLWKLDEVPKVPSEVIDQINIELQQGGIEKLQAELAHLDPEYYQKIDLHNPHRVIRAISVIRYTNQPISSFRTEESIRRYPSINIFLNRPRQELYARINDRVDQMISSGWIEECKNLIKYRQHQSLQTVGYRQIFDFLDGKISLEDAITQIKTKTRQYAKRQITWFSNQGKWHKFHPQDVSGILNFIREIGIKP